MTEEEKKKQREEQERQFEQAMAERSNRAQQLRNYASSPVNIAKPARPYDEWLKSDEARRLRETPEQQAARERSERNNRRLSALADGLIALSNVTGAMAGATPVVQTSMSAAHRKAVDRAAEQRRRNARQYETARQYYAGLQNKAANDYADRYADEVKARRDAAKQADAIDDRVARLRLTKANADRYYEEKVRNNDIRNAQSAERIAISRSKGGGSGGNARNRYMLRINGNTYTYPSAAEYNKAVQKYAKEYGVSTQENRGTTYDPKIVNKKTERIAAEIEWEADPANIGKDLTRNGRKNNGKKSAI